MIKYYKIWSEKVPGLSHLGMKSDSTGIYGLDEIIIWIYLEKLKWSNRIIYHINVLLYNVNNKKQNQAKQMRLWVELSLWLSPYLYTTRATTTPTSSTPPNTPPVISLTWAVDTCKLGQWLHIYN